MTLIFDIFIQHVGSVSCTNNVLNPTSVYVVEGGEAVLECGFESSSMSWDVYNGGSTVPLASDDDVIDNSKYSVSKNPSTGLYYRLHMRNVGVSDLKKYRCEGNVNGVIKNFFLQLILVGMYNYALFIFKVGDNFYSCK